MTHHDDYRQASGRFLESCEYSPSPFAVLADIVFYLEAAAVLPTIQSCGTYSTVLHGIVHSHTTTYLSDIAQ
ncbi:hypothetical protein [Paenibacillus amylolyticus]|uniref:hypothetical protein n=1 Tax=Paenibacillus amylolyticus TaxID=1451 RepID=UPI0034503783